MSDFKISPKKLLSRDDHKKCYDTFTLQYTNNPLRYYGIGITLKSGTIEVFLPTEAYCTFPLHNKVCLF